MTNPVSRLVDELSSPAGLSCGFAKFALQRWHYYYFVNRSVIENSLLIIIKEKFGELAVRTRAVAALIDCATKNIHPFGRPFSTGSQNKAVISLLFFAQ